MIDVICLQRRRESGIALDDSNTSRTQHISPSMDGFLHCLELDKVGAVNVFNCSKEIWPGLSQLLLASLSVRNKILTTPKIYQVPAP